MGFFECELGRSQLRRELSQCHNLVGFALSINPHACFPGFSQKTHLISAKAMFILPMGSECLATWPRRRGEGVELPVHRCSINPWSMPLHPCSWSPGPQPPPCILQVAPPPSPQQTILATNFRKIESNFLSAKGSLPIFFFDVSLTFLIYFLSC